MNAPASPKKWVFTEIIAYEQDVLGLIAYALYKKDKHDTAVSLRQQGYDEPSIEKQLNDFHNQIATIPQRQEHYKNQASDVLNGTVGLMMETSFVKKKEELTAEWRQLDEKNLQLEERKNNLESTIKKQVDEKVKKARIEIHKEELNKLAQAGKNAVLPKLHTRAFLWLWSGFSGVFATIAVGWLLYSIAANNASPETKQKLLREFVESTVTTISGTSQTSTGSPTQ